MTLNPPGRRSTVHGGGSDAWLLFHTAKFVMLRGRPGPDLTGGGNEGYHEHNYHGGLPDDARHVDCAAIRAACLERCRTVFGTGAAQQSQTAQQKNCANRCSIASCQETPLAARTCDANAQTICSSSFRSCSDACTVSFAATAATIQAQASCTTSCCTKFKLCLGQRQCDLRGIIATTCEEGTSVLTQ